MTDSEARKALARLERFIETRWKQTEIGTRARDRVDPMRPLIKQLVNWATSR